MQIKNTIVVAVALGMAANIVAAETYQAEFSAIYGQTEHDTTSAKDKRGSVAGTLYFKEVDVQNYVYGEAAFLNRASNISVSYNQSQTKFDWNTTLPGNIQETGYLKNDVRTSAASVEFYIPNTFLYLAGGISDAKTKSRGWKNTGGVHTTIRDNWGPNSQWHASIGVTPAQGWLIATDFIEDEDIDDVWNIRTKYVADWAGQALNLELEYASFYKEESVRAAFDYYFSRSFSLGGEYTYLDNSQFDDPWSVRATQYFTNRVAVHLGYGQWDSSDSYIAGVSLRF